MLKLLIYRNYLYLELAIYIIIKKSKIIILSYGTFDSATDGTFKSDTVVHLILIYPLHLKVIQTVQLK